MTVVRWFGGRDGLPIARDRERKIILPDRSWDPPPKIGERWEVELQELERFHFATPVRRIEETRIHWPMKTGGLRVETWSGDVKLREELKPIDRVVVHSVRPPKSNWDHGSLVASVCAGPFEYLYDSGAPARTESEVLQYDLSSVNGTAYVEFREIFDGRAVEELFRALTSPTAQIQWNAPPDGWGYTESHRETIDAYTTEEWQEKFGPPPEDVETLVAFVERNGERVDSVILDGWDATFLDGLPVLGCELPCIPHLGEFGVARCSDNPGMYDEPYTVKEVSWGERDGFHVFVGESDAPDCSYAWCALVRCEDVSTDDVTGLVEKWIRGREKEGLPRETP